MVWDLLREIQFKLCSNELFFMKINNISELKIELLQKNITEYKFDNVELKRNWDIKYGCKISMLCNSNLDTSCFLVIGVEDSGELAGHNENWLEKNLENVSKHINEKLDPIVTLVDITTEKIESDYVVIIEARNPGIVVKWNKEAFSGHGTTKKLLAPEEILALNLRLPGITDYSKQLITYEPYPKNIELFCDLGNIEKQDAVLEEYSLKNNQCGRILLGEAKYRVIKYDKKEEIISNETRSGLINILSDLFSEEIRNFYQNKLDDTDRISDAMLREALGNSVGHAAYNENDGELIIEIHPNKLQISNLAYSEYLTLANKWFSSAHKSPNPFLMEVLRTIHKVDEVGRGKKKLLSECLLNGFNAPAITVSDAGRFKRWSLVLDFGVNTARYLKVYNSIQALYRHNKEKSLIASALVLWSDKAATEIIQYFDKYQLDILREILQRDPNPPVVLVENMNRILPVRWVRLLIEEGKESSTFHPSEEARYYQSCKKLSCTYKNGLMTPGDFREMTSLSNSNSDKSLTTKTLKKWVSEGKITKIRRGLYQFIEVSDNEGIEETNFFEENAKSN